LILSVYIYCIRFTLKKERIIVALPVSFLAIFLLVFLNGCGASTTNVADHGTKTQQTAVQTQQTAQPDEAEDGTEEEEAIVAPAPVPAPVPEVAAIVLADGVYNETGTYQSPAQTENVEFAFTIKDGKVVNVERVSTSTVKTSNMFQGLFTTGIQQEIVGKKLSEIGTFDRVNGSSLTSKGFNMALAKLKAKV